MDPPDSTVFSSSLHNESQSTIGNTNCDLSLANLQNENEMLKKKITYLQKIITLKDNTIDDLNAKLLILTEKNNEKQQIIVTTNNNSNNNDDNLSHKKSDSLVSNSTSNSSNNKLKKTIWEIPQRNSNRSVLRTPDDHKEQNEDEIKKSDNDNNDNNDYNDDNDDNDNNNNKINNDIDNTDTKPTLKTHVPSFSVSSITSSHYSDADLLLKESSPKGRSFDNTNNDDTTDISNHQSTLELDLKQGNLTLGSSPRKLSPNRKSFTLTEITAKIDDINNMDKNNIDDNKLQNSSDNDDFHFNSLATPDEPFYKKLNQQESLYSSNSSPIADYFHQKNTINSVSNVNIRNYSGGSVAENINILNSPSIGSNSIQESMLSSPITTEFNRNVTNQKVLLPSTSLQNNKKASISPSSQSVSLPPSLTPSLPPSLPPHPPIPPQHPIQLNSNTINTHKSIESINDSEKFLLNSLNHSIIRIESLIDPLSLTTPIDTSNTSPMAKTKRNNYKISFLVYTDENPSSLTPIYRVKKSYLELIIMDKSIRPLIPSLPLLPDFSHIACLNYKYWANSKKVIQNYINKLLSLLKNQNPLNQSSPIWKNFSNYFEFKMDESMSEDPEYSVLNLQNKITYLLYIRKNFTMKTYDFIKLNFSNDSNSLIMNFLLSKSQEILQRDDVNVVFKNQEIIIKKRKKFPTNKSWIFFAESDYDASELCTKLSNWIGTSISDINDDDQELFDDQFDENDGISKSSSDHTTTSPALNAPWKIFKKSNKGPQQSQQQQFQQQYSQQQSQSQLQSQQLSGLSGLPPLLASPRQSVNTTLNSFSTPASPSKGSVSSISNSNDIFSFKAMPYESNLLSVDNNFNSNSNPNLPLRSPIKSQHKLIHSNEVKFQPIDDTPKYFKSTLNYSFELCPTYKLYGVSVPSIVYQCITFLHHQSGEGFEGIFRLNGMMSEVNKIQEIFNEKYDCELSKLSPIPDVHSIATLLKRYLRNLKDRLISDEITNELSMIINKNGINKKIDDEFNQEKMNHISTLINYQGIQEFKNSFKKIPQLNKNVLFALFKYLREVIKMGKHNKMTINAMSVLMGPNLSQTDGGGQICIVLLENFEQIF
jgi:hypothetical protein